VVLGLLTALQDANWSVRYEAAEALGQVGAGQPEVVPGLLAALRHADGDVRSAAAEALGQVGAGQPEVVPGLLAALRHADAGVREAAAEALGQVEVKNPDQWHEVLVALLRRLYDQDDDVSGAALKAIREHTEGRALPNGPRLVRRLRARRRRLQQMVFWLLMITALLGLGLVGTWLTGVLDATSVLLRFLGVVAALTAFAAGVTQIVGWLFRDFSGQGEKRQQRR
jgi:hypothetical protein